MRPHNDSKLMILAGGMIIGTLNLWALPLKGMAKIREYSEDGNHPVLDKITSGAMKVYLAPYLLCARAIINTDYVD